MNDDKSLELMNLYFDGELEKSKEANLFTLLASDQSKREYFRQLIVVRNSVENSMVEFPLELEKRILRSLGTKSSARIRIFSNNKIFSAISYAVALILLFLSGYLFFKVSSFQDRVDNLSGQIVNQSKTIQMLYNSLPVVEVSATFDNEIIIKPNI